MIVELSQTLQKARPHLADWIGEAAGWAAYLDDDIDLDGVHIAVRESRNPSHWGGTAWPRSASLDRRRHKRRKHSSGRVTMSIGRRVRRNDVIRATVHELRHIGQFARGARANGYLSCVMETHESEVDCRRFEGQVLDSMGRSDFQWWRDLGLVGKPKGRLVRVKGWSDFVNVRVSDRIPRGIIVIESGEAHA